MTARKKRERSRNKRRYRDLPDLTSNKIFYDKQYISILQRMRLSCSQDVLPLYKWPTLKPIELPTSLITGTPGEVCMILQEPFYRDYEEEIKRKEGIQRVQNNA